jgi:hypothetical protein
MVSVLPSSVVYRGFEPLSGKTKDCKIGICCFSAKHVALRRKSKDWLARIQNKVSEWDDMSIYGHIFVDTNKVSFYLGNSRVKHLIQFHCTIIEKSK